MYEKEKRLRCARRCLDGSSSVMFLYGGYGVARGSPGGGTFVVVFVVGLGY